jgi:cytochrome c oxidase cbb3-type subunit III
MHLTTRHFIAAGTGIVLLGSVVAARSADSYHPGSRPLPSARPTATLQTAAPATAPSGRQNRARHVDSAATNPFEKNGAAIGEGARLFVAYNCADCHGGGGSGLMAASLADNRWHYGNTPADLYNSISEGRPGGMPRWGTMIPEEHIWKLAAYVRTLGAGKDVSTMNFTGARVERTGHD